MKTVTGKLTGITRPVDPLGLNAVGLLVVLITLMVFLSGYISILLE